MHYPLTKSEPAVEPRPFLPGRPVLPTFDAFCRFCCERGETSAHAGLCGEGGQELGAYCLRCGQKARS